MGRSPEALAPRCCACSASRRRKSERRYCASASRRRDRASTAQFERRRGSHDRASHAGPRFPDRAMNWSRCASASTWKGVAMIAHAWALIMGAIALVAWWPNPITYRAGGRHHRLAPAGLAILMHDGAHGCLSADEKTNLTLSQWFCAYPVFAETRAYRRYHLQHHARTQQDDDPDLVLSAPFPITKLSYRRKFFRDITGQTGYQQRKAQLLNALGQRTGRWRSAPRISGTSSARNCRQRGDVRKPRRGRRVVGLSAAVAGAASDLDDGHHPHPQHRRTRRRARQRRSLAQHPHHACQFPRASVHRAVLRELPPRASSAVLRALLQSAEGPPPLSESRHAERMEVQPNYAAVLRLATAKPNRDDRPGQLVSNARRAQAGAEVGADQKAGGF